MSKKLFLTHFLAFHIFTFSLAAKQFFIGGHDPTHWAGITMSTSDRQGFGIFLGIEKEGKQVAGYDIFFLIKQVGPNSGDGRYARLVIDTSLPFQKKDKTPILPKHIPSDTLTWEWSRMGENGIVGRILVEADVTIHLRFYAPWDYNSRYEYKDGRIHGVDGSAHFCFISQPGGLPTGHGPEMSLSYRIKRGHSISFGCRITSGKMTPPILPENLSGILTRNRERYQNDRVRVIGSNASLAASIVNNINWMVCLQPEIPALYTPAGRRWIFPGPKGGRDHWTIFEWDAFFNALELGVESWSLAKSTIRAVLNTQYTNGNIPNWRSRWAGTTDRSQPPVGSFVTLKLYQRFRDHGFLLRSYPKLKKFNRFWTATISTGLQRRDGNGNGLLEWGSDTDRLASWMPEWERGVDGRTRAAWESGQDDLPNYDGIPFNPRSGTLELDCVDLNSLYALDCECLSIIAGILGYRKDQTQFINRYKEIKSRMNHLMWDDQTGVYKDRHWDGRLSNKLAATNFFPLIAGIPDGNRASRMLKLLRRPDLFWGEYMVPTINKADPAYSDQQYWRGTIWPPTNYLLYRGLIRYKFYNAAAKLAGKSTALFLHSWDTYQLCRENYDSRTGVGGGRRYQSWGPLFALIGLEEFIDWDIRGGLKMGSAVYAGNSTLENIRDWQNTYQIRLSKKGFQGIINQKVKFSASSPVVLDNIEVSGSRCSMDIFNPRTTVLCIDGLEGERFQVQLDGISTKTEVLRLNLAPGNHHVRIDRDND